LGPGPDPGIITNFYTITGYYKGAISRILRDQLPC